MRYLRAVVRWAVVVVHLGALAFSAQTYAQPATQLEALQLIDSNTNHSRAAIWRVMTELVGASQTEVGWNTYYTFGGTYTQSGVGLLATLAKSSERQDISDNVKNTIWKNLDVVRVQAESIADGINGVDGVRARLGTAVTRLTSIESDTGAIRSSVAAIATTLSGMSVNVASIAGTVTVQLPEMVTLLTSVQEILAGSGLIDAKLVNVLEFMQRAAEGVEVLKSEFIDWRGTAEGPSWSSFVESFDALDDFLRDKLSGEASGTATAATSFGVGLGVPVRTGPVSAGQAARDALDLGVGRVDTPENENFGAPVWSFTVPMAAIGSPMGVALNNFTVTADFAQIPSTVRLVVHAFVLCFVTLWGMGHVWEELRRYG